MVEKLKLSHNRIMGNVTVASIIFSGIILLGLLLNSTIPIILLFLYAALFYMRFTLAILITLPLYDAYFNNGWLSINKIGIIIMIIVFLFNISYKKVKLGKYEWILLVITAVITFSYIVAMLNPVFLFMRDEIMPDYLLETLPKLGFIMAFLLAVKTSGRYDMREMMESAVSFIPMFMIVITILSVGSMINITQRRYMLMSVRPNYFSVFVTCMAPFIIKGYFNSKHIAGAIVTVLALSGTAYLVSLTASRTGLILLAISAILSIIFFVGKRTKKLMVLIGIIFAGAIGAAFIPSFQDMIFRLLKASDISSEFLPQRMNLLKSALRIFARNPILGYGGVKEASAILIFTESGEYRLSHNAYLDIAIQYGVFGILAFATLYLTMFTDFITRVFDKSGSYKWQYPLYIVLINIILAGMVLSLNFRDMHIYIIAFIATLPSYKGADRWS